MRVLFRMLVLLLLPVGLVAGGCADIEAPPENEPPSEHRPENQPPTTEDPMDGDSLGVESVLKSDERVARYGAIRTAANARGIGNAFLLAGIAITETGLAHCWSEAQWACQGPNSSACGGGPVIAGSADGPCNHQQGGLGMFQFDAGTYQQTLNLYGNGVLTIDGQIGAAIDYTVAMVRDSAYTTNAETDAKARAWINAFDIHDPTHRDQWIKTVLRYYNGCQPHWNCWNTRYRTYTDGMQAGFDEPGGTDFWGAPVTVDPPADANPDQGTGTRCGDSPLVVGAIEAKYLQLGGCNSVLGAPRSEEAAVADGVGRFSTFEHGAIYWTPVLGAYEVHGAIFEKWSSLGGAPGVLGYPTRDETRAPDGVGRYSVFERGSIYWSGAIGAFAVHGKIRDKWAEVGWEAGDLGYPVSDEYAVSVGRRNDFEGGSITWNSSTNSSAVDLAGGPAYTVLDIDFEIQETGYWCGPAAAHNTLSARMSAPNQQRLANDLGTTQNGTDWIGQITSVLNNYLDGSPYVTTEMPNDPPTQAQRDQLWNDIVTSIDNNYPVVANIVAPATNHPPGYPNYTIWHYFTVIGYNMDTRQVFIADSANFSGNTLYWLSFDQLTTLIPPKGYSAFRP